MGRRLRQRVRKGRGANLRIRSTASGEVAVLAHRLARLSPAQIGAIKGAVDAALGVDLTAGLEQGGRFVGRVYPAPEEAAERVRRALEGACGPGSR